MFLCTRQHLRTRTYWPSQRATARTGFCCFLRSAILARISPVIATPCQAGGDTLGGTSANPWVSSCVPHSAPGGSTSGCHDEEKGEPMTEEGTLSIMRRGTRYQVRYASNNPHDRERLPRACPDEDHLAALLHHFGTTSAVISQVCADVRHGKLAVLLVVVSVEALRAFFPPIHAYSKHAIATRASGRQSASRPPQGQVLWVHSRAARETAEILQEEFALLLEEAALLLEEAAVVVEESHQLLEKCHE